MTMPTIHTAANGDSFSKQADCPPSARLLAAAATAPSEPPPERIAQHLADCDFCGAEFSLLRKHGPQDEALMEAPAPPLPLLLLARGSWPVCVDKSSPHTAAPPSPAPPPQTPMMLAGGSGSHAAMPPVT